MSKIKIGICSLGLALLVGCASAPDSSVVSSDTLDTVSSISQSQETSVEPEPEIVASEPETEPVEVYRDDKVIIAYSRLSDYGVVFEVENLTNVNITIQARSISINGRSLNDIIMSENVAPMSIGEIYAETLVDTNVPVETVGGQLRIIDFDESFESYNATFVNVPVDGSTEQIESSTGVENNEMSIENFVDRYNSYAENNPGMNIAQLSAEEFLDNIMSDKNYAFIEIDDCVIGLMLSFSNNTTYVKGFKYAVPIKTIDDTKKYEDFWNVFSALSEGIDPKITTPQREGLINALEKYISNDRIRNKPNDNPPVYAHDIVYSFGTASQIILIVQAELPD